MQRCVFWICRKTRSIQTLFDFWVGRFSCSYGRSIIQDFPIARHKNSCDGWAVWCSLLHMTTPESAKPNVLFLLFADVKILSGFLNWPSIQLVTRLSTCFSPTSKCFIAFYFWRFSVMAPVFGCPDFTVDKQILAMCDHGTACGMVTFHF